ncbi:MAG: ABC transporter ATP-binding protein [Micrococcales bacterium]|nr:ABC transporter ATP-binding protein [Micrococcales bacterium]MCL2667648.1 ABC transporter ATP-binding protein [Micrococcales bacterium]
MPTDAAIEAVDLRKTYSSRKRTVTALDGLSLTVPTGQVFALLGPNGAGKSTTVKILSTLATADSGSACVGGFDVGRDARRVRQSIGYVSQGTSADARMTPRENIIMSARIRGVGAGEARTSTARLVATLGLDECADQYVKTLSGGQRRRVDIACALVHAPQVVFLDEPTAGLDPEARAALWQIIVGMSADNGLSVIVTTHYMDEADRLCDHVLLIDHGRAVVGGTPDELKASIGGTGLTVTVPAAQPDDVRGAVETVGVVRDLVVETTGDDVRLAVRTDDATAALAALTGALDHHGLDYGAVAVSRPSLDDVYLRYVGHSYNYEGDLT